MPTELPATGDPRLPVHVQVVVRADAADLTVAAADRVVDLAAGAMASSGRFVMALSGGSTPRALYTLLASPPYATRIDWSRVHLFWGDERCVSPDHPASNYRMTRETLLDKVPIPAANIHRVRGEDQPEAAAVAYEAELRSMFRAGRPRFDLVLLGMGDNGHTASLFPGLQAVRETERWTMAEYVGEVTMWRVTLTPAALNGAAHLLFLVSGADKASMLRRVLEGPHDPDTLPAQAVHPDQGEVTWLVDVAAAGALTRAPNP